MVSKLLTFIIESTHGLKQSSNQSINQARRPDFYKYTRLPVTRWVKLSLNFELLVVPKYVNEIFIRSLPF